jgi:predicted AAA+ superfamily ATPase
MYFYRTHQGAECDLVLTIANKPEISVEIKYTSAPRVSKGLRTSIDDLGTNKNYIICMSEDDYPIAENIIACNMETFITKYLGKLKET